MAVTITTDVPLGVQIKFAKTYIKTFWESMAYWDLVDWEGQGYQTGSAVRRWFNTPLDRAAQTRAEGSDLTPIKAKDLSYVDVSWVDRGNGIQVDRMVQLQNQVNMMTAFAEQVAHQQADWLNSFVRDTISAGTMVRRMNARATRAAVVVGDVPSINWGIELESQLAGMYVEPFSDGSYVAMCHPTGLAEWRKLLVAGVGTYSDPAYYYTGKSSYSTRRLRNERFRIGNIRFVEDKWGKLYLGAGTPAQTATTLSADAAAGATAIAVTDATGLAVGNFITLGTIESSTTAQPLTEQVEIMAVSGTDLTIRGAGNTETNMGLKFAHASGSAVTEAPNVVGMTIVGKNSIYGIYESSLGKEGEQFVKWNTATFVPNLFKDIGWHWVGGVSAMNKRILRAEFATTAYLATSN